VPDDVLAQRVRDALFDAAPGQALERVARSTIDNDPESGRARLLKACESLRESGLDEAHDDALMDLLMDRLTGWCGPEYRL
jgi:hypothetical protein